MFARLTLILSLLLISFVAALPTYDSPEDLLTALEADTLLLGAEVQVAGLLAADLFHEAYLQAPRATIWPGEGKGLCLRTSEHLAEVGDQVLVLGSLERDHGEIIFRSKSIQVTGRAPEEIAYRRLTAQELNENAMLFKDRLVELRDLEVRRFMRGATGSPWLAVCKQGDISVDVELRDGAHPVLVEGMHIDRLRGVFRRSREYWRIAPRTGDDIQILPQARTCSSASEPYGQMDAPVRLDEICYDPAQSGEGEGAESFAVVNTGRDDFNLSGWRVSDGEGEWIFPDGSLLAAGERFRVARKKERYFFEFGQDCDFSFDRNPSPGDSCLVLSNAGDELLLMNDEGIVADLVCFEDARGFEALGWKGPTIRPYRFSNFVSKEGQVLLRKRNVKTRALIDSDRASDWISDPNDPDWGMQLNFPGWDRELFHSAAACEEEAEIQAFVSPEYSFEGVRDFLRSAERRLEIEIYLITHPLVVDELLAALDRGVQVTVLLEGEVFGARGGTYDSVLGLMHQLLDHPSGNAQVYFWRNGDDPRHLGSDTDIPDRYNHVHQKFVLADRRRLLVSSDNFTQSSLPADPKENGTGGSRGVILVTDASCAVERAVEIFEADCDPWRQRDIRQFVPHESIKESIPRISGDRKNYQALHDAPYSAREKAVFELSQSPENSLRPDQGYLGLVNAAGKGDWIFVEQQYERPHWGYGDRQRSNPRLDAYIEAARRGASVRILLSGNRAAPKSEKTRDMVNGIAAAEGIDIEVRMGWIPRTPSRRDPIHNKMLLAQIGGKGWSHVGSANGSATASLYNREMGLSVRSNGLHDYLLKVFASDWIRAGGEAGDLP
jgi:phosphatidylserine/phosphatidylglycerophosphate/cardiolipin synthase-like enzyme